MKCEKCGAEINRIMVDSFIYDGSDIESAECFSEMDENAVVIDVDANWTGYELTEEEQQRTITCPCCKEFPFKNKEIQVHEIIRIVCFKEVGAKKFGLQWMHLPEPPESEVRK